MRLPPNMGHPLLFLTLKRLPGMGGTCQAIFREETTILTWQNRGPADLLVEDTSNTNKSFVS